MKPSISGSLTSRSSRVLSVLSLAVLFTTTGCYTKLASSEGDHWGYTGPVKQKVVVRETEDTVVIRETRVIHQPQPVITDTVIYSNTRTGEENVVVNNYFTPPPAYGFGTYDPWRNTYPTWYDDYWYRPGFSVSINIGNNHHHPRWWNNHWRRHSYYQAYWDYDFHNPYNGWYHANYRGPGWAYYDPYYPYPPMYGYAYGCYTPMYDPYYWPFYGYGGSYYGGYYGGHHGHHGHGHYGHGYDDDDDDRDRSGRERRGGNTGGEGRGRGGETTDNTGDGSNNEPIVPRDNRVQVKVTAGDRVDAIPASQDVTSRDPIDAADATTNLDNASNGQNANTRTGRIGDIQVSTGEIPLSDERSSGTRNASSGSSGGSRRGDVSSPAQNAPGVYVPPTGTRPSSNASSAGDQPVRASRPVVIKPEQRDPIPMGSATNGSSDRNTRSSGETKRTETKPARVKEAPRSSSTEVKTKETSGSSSSRSSSTYTPRSSSSGSSSSSSGTRSSGSSSSGSSRGSESRSSTSNSDGGSRGRR